MKQNQVGRWQPKNLLITNRHLVQLNEYLDPKRSTDLKNLAALTLKRDDDLTDKYDFLVHIKNGDDYMFYSKHREEIIACLRSAYFMLTD